MNWKTLSRVIIIVIGLAGLGAIYLIREPEFDYDLESFFPEGDAEFEFFLEYREKYGTDNDFLLVALKNEQGIFRKGFLNKLDSFTEEVARLENVTGVQSPTNLKQLFLIDGAPPVREPYLHPNSPEEYGYDSTRIYQTKWLVGSFFSTDAKSVCLFVQTKHFLSKSAGDSLTVAVEELLQRYEFDEYHVGGKVSAMKYYIDKMKFEFVFLFLLAALLVTIFLYFMFRSVWGIVIPIIVILTSIIFTLAGMKLTGSSLNIMTTLLPCILFVVGTSDAIHLTSRYIDELRKGLSRLAALKVTIKEIGLATLLTSLTTALGFLTLLVANIRPIREFGLYAALGVVIAFVVSVLLLPSLYLNLRKPNTSRRLNKSVWEGILRKLFIFVLRNRVAILIGYVFLTGITVWGATKIRVNNFLLEDLRESAVPKQDFRFIEKNFAGVRPFEMAIRVKDSSESLLSYDKLIALDKLENYLEQKYELGFLISPAGLIKQYHQIRQFGNPDYYRLPDRATYQSWQKDLSNLERLPEVKLIFSDSFREARIQGKMEDIGSFKIFKKNESLLNYINDSLSDAGLNAHITGSAHLMDVNNQSLSGSFVQGLGIAFLVIAVLVGILFKSFRMVLISFFPNFIPLLFIAGLMGFIGLDLKVATSIIFTIAFGIAVDDTIHILSKYKLELLKGRTSLYALKRTFISTGKAIIVTSIVLCAGFITLAFSGLLSSMYMGILVSITLLVALIADLTLFPVLLLFLSKRK